MLHHYYEDEVTLFYAANGASKPESLKLKSKRTADEDVGKMLRYSNEMLLNIYQTKLESFQLKSGEMTGGKK